jgi:hypothetical protein
MSNGCVNHCKIVLLALLVPAAACNDGPLDLENRLVCSLTLGCEVDPLTLGPLGGTVSFLDSAVTITVPAGALTQYATFGIDSATTWIVDPLVNSGTPFDFRPHGVAFAESVAVALTYDPDDLAQHVLEDELRLFRFGDGGWQEIPGSSVDTEANIVSANVTNFSTLYPRGVDVATVIVDPVDTSVVEGQAVQLSAVTLDASNDTLHSRVGHWSSSNSFVATVDTVGSVSAVAPVTVFIVDTAGGTNATVHRYHAGHQRDRVGSKCRVELNRYSDRDGI